MPQDCSGQGEVGGAIEDDPGWFGGTFGARGIRNGDNQRYGGACSTVQSGGPGSGVIHPPRTRSDVLNSKGYTQAAWSSRIPNAAWCLMAAIAIFCSLLIGYGGRPGGARTSLLLVLPLVIAISLMLIADIDSPRGGVVRVHAQNLASLSRSLHQRNHN